MDSLLDHLLSEAFLLLSSAELLPLLPLAGLWLVVPLLVVVVQAAQVRLVSLMAFLMLD
jgi:hypothetical protein